MSAMWIEYGKTYGQLCHDLEQVGESIVGVQVDIKDPEERRIVFIGGRFLIGDLDAAGDLSGEEYIVLGGFTVTRYRRLLTAEQLQEE